jgi:hypothetical protein
MDPKNIPPMLDLIQPMFQPTWNFQKSPMKSSWIDLDGEGNEPKACPSIVAIVILLKCIQGCHSNHIHPTQENANWASLQNALIQLCACHYLQD